MAMMLVVYRTPKDPESFDRHYFNVHVPLARQLPGITRFQTSQGTVLPLAGAGDTYRVSLLHFVSLAAIKEAFASDIGKACAADRRKFAPNDEDVQMFLFDDQDV